MLLFSYLFLTLLVPGSLAQSLPSYSGTYDVGLIDVEVPVRDPRNITTTTFTSNGKPAFFLQTVLFSLYYPIAPGTKSTATRHSWTGNPVDCLAKGIVIYANISSVTDALISKALNSVAGNVTIPAQADAPLATGTSPLPVLLFSVGDIALRTWYSQYAGLLAASGVVVAVVEHRDGSVACSVVKEKGQANRTVQYIQASQLSDPIRGNTTEMVMEQRSFRQAEIQETAYILQQINSGNGQQIYQNNSRNEGSSLSSFTNRLDANFFVVGGHSFGATLALQALSDPTIPAKAGLFFDPGKESGPLNNNFNQSVLISDSQSWSGQPTEFYGQQHFDVVKGIAQGALNRTGSSWFMTLLGTAHTSITDAPLLVGSAFLGFFDPTSVNISLGKPETNIKQYVEVSMDFFRFLGNGSRSGILARNITTPDFVAINLNDSNAQGLVDGWEIHVAPLPGTNASNSTSTPNSAALVRPYNFIVLLLALLAILL